jgi:hypothetical protein
MNEIELIWNGCKYAHCERRSMRCHDCTKLADMETIEEKIIFWCKLCDCESCSQGNTSLERCTQFPDHNDSFCEHREQYIKCLKQLTMRKFIKEIKTNHIAKDVSNIICNKYIVDIGKIIEQNLLELYLTEIKNNNIAELNKMITVQWGELWLERRLQIVLEHLANENRIQVTQYTGNRVGQSILFVNNQNNEPNQIIELGGSWNKNDGFLESWKTNDYALKEYINWTEEDWQKQFGLWCKYIDPTHTKVCLMIAGWDSHTIPEFEEFEELHTFDFMMRYPSFIPVYINIPNHSLFVQEINNNLVN